MKSKIYNKILSAVEEATEIDRARILSREKSREVVEARSLLFYYLYAKEFSHRQIADITGNPTDLKAKIIFDEHGEKILILKYAKIRVVQG